MDLQTIFAALGVVSALGTSALGWYVRGAREDTQAATASALAAHTKLSDLRVEIYRDFVPHHRFDKTVSEINHKLDRIIDTLGEKADKP